MIIRFAKLGLNNEVEKIDLVEGSIAITENEGIAFLQGIYNHTSWKQSYTDGTRKNAAGKGMIYDESRDAFIPPQPYNSWTLNETTCQWEAPSSMPDDNQNYIWNEETTTWDLRE
jgi:hypothetical protein|tara:strand:- start:1769 stop:2113 length:345 start_codon:yes stop_codon:yes gene_type:complete